MTVHLPEIGIPSIRRAKSLLEEYPKNIVGSFWVMCGRRFNDTQKIPDWWIDNLREDNQAQSIIDGFEKGYFKGEYNSDVCSWSMDVL